MGKTSGKTGYVSSDPVLLDHYVAGNVDMTSLGDLIASNIIIENKKEDTMTIYPSSVSGELVGVKIESVNYEENPINAQSIVNVTINEVELNVFDSAVFENGRYLVAFFNMDSR
eukprot:85825_1